MKIPNRSSIEPRADKHGNYQWSIWAEDGTLLARSPYLFASVEGAQLSADLWFKELQSMSQADPEP